MPPIVKTISAPRLISCYHYLLLFFLLLFLSVFLFVFFLLFAFFLFGFFVVLGFAVAVFPFALPVVPACPALFAGGGNTSQMPVTELSGEDFDVDGNIGILTLLVKAGLASSNGEARRNVQQGGVSVDGEKVTEPKSVINKDNITEDGIVLKRGKKKFMKIVVK